MKFWENRAMLFLKKTLTGIPSELNELDWKSDISTNSEKLAKHLSAFSHLTGGGFLVFGLNNDGSFAKSLEKADVEEILRNLIICIILVILQC